MTKRKKLFKIAAAFIMLAVVATTTKAARVLWSATGPDASRSDPAGDPVEKLVRRETLASIPELRQKPAPFQRIQIPDPLENQRLLGLREQPVDNDPPVAATGTPPRPVLPVAKP